MKRQNRWSADAAAKRPRAESQGSRPPVVQVMISELEEAMRLIAARNEAIASGLDDREHTAQWERLKERLLKAVHNYKYSVLDSRVCNDPFSSKALFKASVDLGKELNDAKNEYDNGAITVSAEVQASVLKALQDQKNAAMPQRQRTRAWVPNNTLAQRENTSERVHSQMRPISLTTFVESVSPGAHDRRGETGSNSDEDTIEDDTIDSALAGGAIEVDTDAEDNAIDSALAGGAKDVDTDAEDHSVTSNQRESGERSQPIAIVSSKGSDSTKSPALAASGDMQDGHSDYIILTAPELATPTNDDRVKSTAQVLPADGGSRSADGAAYKDSPHVEIALHAGLLGALPNEVVGDGGSSSTRGTIQETDRNNEDDMPERVVHDDGEGVRRQDSTAPPAHPELLPPRSANNSFLSAFDAAYAKFRAAGKGYR